MIVQELVARFGISVEGIEKLRAAIRQFGAFRKEAQAAINPLKGSAASSALVAAGVGKVGAESKRSSRSVLLFSTALARVKSVGASAVSTLKLMLLALLRVVGAAVKGAAVIATFGAGLVIAAARAAKARKEFVATAKAIGTTGQNLETISSIFRYLGLGNDAGKEAEGAVGKINDVLKAIRAGGEEAEEARKKFARLGIDSSFKIDPKTGQMRDAAAVLLDVVAAYKLLNEQAAAYRKEATAIEKKSPKKAAGLRTKALANERKATSAAENAGIEGKLKVAIDDRSSKGLKDAMDRSAREMPTTSNRQEARQKIVADEWEAAGLKVDAVIKGATDRLIDLGTSISIHVLPPLNRFLEGVVSFAKKIGLIGENVGERDARIEQEQEAKRAKGMSGSAPETPQQRRNRTVAEGEEKMWENYKKNRGTPTEAPLPPERPGGMPRTPTPTKPSWLEELKGIFSAVPAIKAQVSPEVNAAKMQSASQSKVENNLTATATATASFNGIFDETAARRIQQMIDKAIKESVGKLRGNSLGGLDAAKTAKANNTATVSMTSP